MAACVALLGAAGCGEEGGVGEGAVATVYVAAPLCLEAERELAREGSRAGGLRIRAACLAGVEDAGQLDLAQIGANARRATEDSSAVAYIGETTAAATRFSRPILEEAGIAQLPATSGRSATAQLLAALREPEGTANPREAVLEKLTGP